MTRREVEAAVLLGIPWTRMATRRESAKQKSGSSSGSQKTPSKSKDGTQAKGREQDKAGPSHGGFPALPTASTTPGMKCSPLSQSPKKVAAKVACWLTVQQLQGQLPPAQVYLPSAPSGMKYYQTLHKSVTSLGQEWDHLSREARAAEELYTTTGPLGQRMSMLMQLAQASRIAALPVPQIQLQELHLKNAGTALRDQAMAQNLIIFGER